MRFVMALMIIALFLPALPATAAEGVAPSTMQNYKEVKELVEKLSQSKAAKYAPEIVKAAQDNIVMAAEGIRAGDEYRSKHAVDVAKVQVKLAGALAEEREAAEKNEAIRKEIKKAEERLSNILSGKGDSR